MRFWNILILILAARAGFSQSVPGLLATYSDGKTRVRMVVAAPEFYLDPDESPHPAIGRSFEAEWTGLLSIARSGEYRFDAGQVVVSIDGRGVSGQPVPLTAGRHAFSM